MPLAVTDLTNSRREILIMPRLSLPERLVLRVRHYPCLDLRKDRRAFWLPLRRDQRRLLVRRQRPPHAALKTQEPVAYQISRT